MKIRLGALIVGIGLAGGAIAASANIASIESGTAKSRGEVFLKGDTYCEVLSANPESCLRDEPAPQPVAAQSVLWDSLESALPTKLAMDEEWLRLLPEALCPATAIPGGRSEVAEEQGALIRQIWVPEQAEIRAKAWEEMAQRLPESLNPNPPRDCKIVRVDVMKSGRLGNGDTVALIRFGKAILPPEAANAEELRANEAAAKQNPKGFEKDKAGYFVVHDENLEFVIVQARPSKEGLKLVDLVSAADPSSTGDLPGA
jgi:hypothetical protein